MPLYSFECLHCKGKSEVVLGISDRDTPQFCKGCGERLSRRLTGCQIQMDIAGYSCPITGKWIGSRREHKANLARHGCRVLEGGESEGARRGRARAEQEMDKGVDETLDRLIEGMPTRAKEQLEGELRSGMDLTVERS